LYEVRTDAQAVPGAEIEEVLWVDADSHADLQLATLTSDLILPLYVMRQAALS
ncbi:NUDIX domain-containing protein, partial [Pseudomonas syringae pv. tagetis]